MQGRVVEGHRLLDILPAEIENGPVVLLLDPGQEQDGKDQEGKTGHDDIGQQDLAKIGLFVKFLYHIADYVF